MDKRIEKEFFKAFEFGGVVHSCFDYLRQKYDLGFKMRKEDEEKPKETLPDNWQHYYDVKLPQQINEATKAFDDSVICYTDSPLMDEIASNIDSLTGKERDRYVFSLLRPFKDFSDNIHPEAEIKKLRGEVNGICGIKDFEKDLAMWENMPQDKQLTNINGEPAGTPKEQADACKELIEEHKYRIERANYVANRYREIANESYDNREEISVEACFDSFWSIEIKFANRLDALLLERGINLLWYQQESGIYLKNHRCITDVDYYIGSYELARKYIDEALPKLDKQAVSENPKLIGNDIKTMDENNLPSKLNTDKAKKILQKAIQANLCDDSYTWKGSMQLLAYFADKMSHYLELTYKMDKDGNIQTSWKPFETLFEYEGKVQGKAKLKGAKQNWMKNNTRFEPTGHEKIDALFE